MGFCIAHNAVDYSNAFLALSDIFKFSAKSITLLTGGVFN